MPHGGSVVAQQEEYLRVATVTQLVEGVALGTVKEEDVECPFHDEDHKHSPKPENKFEGNASTLGDALVAGDDSTSTVVRKDKPYSDYKREFEKEADPDKRPFSKREVQLDKRNKDTWYPLGFQAHHLIPAAESLAKAKTLLTFMREGKKACCPLGYDVNGNQNGVWLPGKHPVDGNGLDLWKGGQKPAADEQGGRKRVSIADDEGKKWSYVLLKGKRPGTPGAFDDSNMRWLYVQAAMTSLGERQFHDRHPTYSGAVLKHLNSLGALLQKFAGSDRPKKLPGCDKCSKTPEGERKPPIALLGALNGLSAHYRGMVVGRTTHSIFYTSSWCDPNRNPFKKKEKRQPRVKRKGK